MLSQHNTMLPLQAAQTSLYFLEKIYPHSTSNHRSVAVEITGPIDIIALQKAMTSLVDRHEVLRARFSEKNQEGALSIVPTENLPGDFADIQCVDATHLAHAPAEKLFDTLKKLNRQSFIEETFQLNKGPLFRCILVKMGDNLHQFAMLFHHIIIDETSIGIIFKDLSAFYNAFLQNKEPELPPIPSQATLDFSLSATEVQKRLAYWTEKLKELNTISIQTDMPPQTSFKFNGDRFPFKLSRDYVKKFKSVEKFKPYSLNQIILTAFYSLLYRYSGETDICVGITSANRRHQHISASTMENLVNCHFNSVPIRTAFDKSITFAELLLQVKNNIGNALKNQLPIDVVFQRGLSPNIKAALRTASPFNVLFVLNQKKPTLTLSNTVCSYPQELYLGRSKFPYFGINLDKLYDGSYQGVIEYNTDLFHAATMERLISHLFCILDAAFLDPDCRIATIPVLLEEEKKRIAHFNQTEMPKRFKGLVPDFLDQQAKQFPKSRALVFHDENNLTTTEMNYSELNTLTTKLANSLKEQGAGPGLKIGISLTRSHLLVIAIYAILKTGSAFVTLETEKSEHLTHKTKQSNLAFILVDDKTKSLFNTTFSGANFGLITSTTLQKQIRGNNTVPLINLDNKKTQYLIQVASTVYQAPTVQSTDLAYIMYTSGTSGNKAEPKGVIVSHASFANLLNALLDEHLPPATRVLCTALPTFDAFLYDMLVALATQGEMHLCFEKGRYSPQILENIISQEKINFGVFLPDLLSVLNEKLNLEYVITMGATPHLDTLNLWAKAKPRILKNGFGLTETGVCLSLQNYRPGNDHTLIGQPISNMRIFILNPENLSLCPFGVPGEIYAAGPGIAEAYLNNPELTARKFQKLIFDVDKQLFLHPHDGEEKYAIKLFATGDYGCYHLLPDKSLSVKFMGRKDRQVKINGVQVELDVVETILSHHPLVKDITVLPNHDTTALRAYLIPKDTQISLETLHTSVYEFLTKTLLPSVAYPNTFIIMKSFPMTQNGKKDIRAFPNPPVLPIIRPQNLTLLQRNLLKIWAEVLGRQEDQLDINKTFKELGGNSLSKAHLEMLINKRLELAKKINVQQLSDHMSILKLATLLESYMKPKTTPIKPPGNVSFLGNRVILFHSSLKPTAPKNPLPKHPAPNT